MCRETCFLEAGNPGNMAKSVYSSCENWIFVVSNKPGKIHLVIFPAVWQQLFDHYLSFLKDMLLTVSTGKSSPSPVFTELSWQWVWHNTHGSTPHWILRTLPIELFTLNSCALLHSFLTILVNMRFTCCNGRSSIFHVTAGACSLKSEKCTRFLFLFLMTAVCSKCFYCIGLMLCGNFSLNLELRAWRETAFSPKDPGIIAVSNLPRKKHRAACFPSLWPRSLKYLCFWNTLPCCFLIGNPSDSTVLADFGKNTYSQHSRIAHVS